MQMPKDIRVPALKETQHQWGQNYKQKPCMWQLLQITQEGEGRLSGDVSPQASGKKGIWHEKMFTLHCLVRKGFHTYFKGRKRNLREIRWLGQGHTAWKWQNLTLMTPSNKLSVLVTGSLRLGLRRAWLDGTVVGMCVWGTVFREKLRETNQVENQGFYIWGKWPTRDKVEVRCPSCVFSTQDYQLSREGREAVSLSTIERPAQKSAQEKLIWSWLKELGEGRQWLPSLVELPLLQWYSGRPV